MFILIDTGARPILAQRDEPKPGPVPPEEILAVCEARKRQRDELAQRRGDRLPDQIGG